MKSVLRALARVAPQHEIVVFVSRANRALFEIGANVRLVECLSSNEHIPARILTQQLQYPVLLRRHGIDVLHALAEGQEMLSRRIRDAKLDYARDSVPVVDRCPQAESSDTATPHSLAGASPTASIGIRSEAPTDKGDLGPGPPSVNGDAGGSSPEPSTGTTAATVNLTVPETAPPSNPPAAIVTPTDLSREATARTDWLNSALPDDTATEALNRNYNFFDELDARLADLQDPADRSDDS